MLSLNYANKHNAESVQMQALQALQLDNEALNNVVPLKKPMRGKKRFWVEDIIFDRWGEILDPAVRCVVLTGEGGGILQQPHR